MNPWGAASVCALVAISLVTTLWALVSAKSTTRASLQRARERSDKTTELQDAEALETAARRKRHRAERYADTRTETDAELNARHAREDLEANERWEGIFRDAGLVRANLGNLARRAEMESIWVLQTVLDANSGNAVLLMVGIVTGAVAAVWSIFL